MISDINNDLKSRADFKLFAVSHIFAKGMLIELRTFRTTDVSDQTLRTRFFGHFGPDFGTFRTM
jgi:hypothetical protein